MSEMKGLLRICDRCGEQVFLKCMGDHEAYPRRRTGEADASEWRGVYFINRYLGTRK